MTAAAKNEAHSAEERKGEKVGPAPVSLVPAFIFVQSSLKCSQFTLSTISIKRLKRDSDEITSPQLSKKARMTAGDYNKR